LFKSSKTLLKYNYMTLPLDFKMKALFTKSTFLVFAASMILGCAKKPELTVEPTLEYLGASKRLMKQSALLQDTTQLNFRITDGDGDLGDLDNRRKFDVKIKDKRTGNIYDQFIIPEIPQQGANNGIVGTMRITLYTTCCILQPCDPFDNQPNEKLPLEIFITDRAGNRSNLVNIDDLTLKCSN
jgi:hypothetical protein